MTGPATPPDWDAIARYLAGESSASEAAAVRSWLEANPRDRELVHRLDAVASLEPPANVDVEAALQRVHRKLAAAERPALRLERGGASRSTKPAPNRVRSITAIAGLAAAAGAAFAIVQSRLTVREPVSAPAKHYVAGTGKTDSVVLADGSRVILGPQSTLEVPGTFGAGERTVRLTGDAYFDVRHDASRPFSVRAGSAVIQDIGTTFTIESDGADVATVSVVEGSVSLKRENAATGVVLGAGDRGSLGAAGDAVVERNAVRPEDTAWISGRLSFRDAPLARVAAEVQRWYGVTLRVADSSLLQRRVTTSFEGEPADKVLQILELTLGAPITRTGDTAVISSPRGSSTSR